MKKIIKHTLFLVFSLCLASKLSAFRFKKVANYAFPKTRFTAIFESTQNVLAYQDGNKIVVYHLIQKISRVFEFDKPIDSFYFSSEGEGHKVSLVVCFLDLDSFFRGDSFHVYQSCDIDNGNCLAEEFVHKRQQVQQLFFINFTFLNDKALHIGSFNNKVLFLKNGRLEVFPVKKMIQRITMADETHVKLYFQDGSCAVFSLDRFNRSSVDLPGLNHTVTPLSDAIIAKIKTHNPFDIVAIKKNHAAQCIGVLFQDRSFIVFDHDCSEVIWSKEMVCRFTFFTSDIASYCLAVISEGKAILLDLDTKKFFAAKFFTNSTKKYSCVFVRDERGGSDIYILKATDAGTVSYHKVIHMAREDVFAIEFLEKKDNTFLKCIYKDCTGVLIDFYNEKGIGIKKIGSTACKKYSYFITNQGTILLLQKESTSVYNALSVSDILRRDIPVVSCNLFSSTYAVVQYEDGMRQFVDLTRGEVLQIKKDYFSYNKKRLVLVLSDDQIVLLNVENNKVIKCLPLKKYLRCHEKQLLFFHFFHNHKDLEDYFIMFFTDYTCKNIMSNLRSNGIHEYALDADQNYVAIYLPRKNSVFLGNRNTEQMFLYKLAETNGTYFFCYSPDSRYFVYKKEGNAWEVVDLANPSDQICSDRFHISKDEKYLFMKCRDKRLLVLDLHQRALLREFKNVRRCICYQDFDTMYAVIQKEGQPAEEFNSLDCFATPCNNITSVVPRGNFIFVCLLNKKGMKVIHRIKKALAFEIQLADQLDLGKMQVATQDENICLGYSDHSFSPNRWCKTVDTNELIIRDKDIPMYKISSKNVINFSFPNEHVVEISPFIESVPWIRAYNYCFPAPSVMRGSMDQDSASCDSASCDSASSGDGVFDRKRKRPKGPDGRKTKRQRLDSSEAAKV